MITAKEIMNYDKNIIVKELLGIGFSVQEIATLTQMPFTLVQKTMKDSALKKRDDLADDPEKRAKQIMLATLAIRQITSQRETRRAIDRYWCIEGPGKKTIQAVAQVLQDLCNPSVSPDTKAEIDFLMLLVGHERIKIDVAREARKLFKLIRQESWHIRSGDPTMEMQLFLTEQYRQFVMPDIDAKNLFQIVTDLLTAGTEFRLTVDHTMVIRHHFGIGFRKKTLKEIAIELRKTEREVKTLYDRALANLRTKARVKKIDKILFSSTGFLAMEVKRLQNSSQEYRDQSQITVEKDKLPDGIAQRTLSDQELKKEGLRLSGAMIEKLKKLGIETVDDVYRINIEHDPRLHQTEGIGAKTRRKLQEVQDWAKYHTKLKYPTE